MQNFVFYSKEHCIDIPPFAVLEIETPLLKRFKINWTTRLYSDWLAPKIQTLFTW